MVKLLFRLCRLSTQIAGAVVVVVAVDKGKRMNAADANFLTLANLLAAAAIVEGNLLAQHFGHLWPNSTLKTMLFR